MTQKLKKKNNFVIWAKIVLVFALSKYPPDKNIMYISRIMCRKVCRRFHGDVIGRVTWASGTTGWQKIFGWRAPRVFCLDSCLVYINIAHTQDHDYVLYLCGGRPTSGILWTARFSLLSLRYCQD